MSQNYLDAIEFISENDFKETVKKYPVMDLAENFTRLFDTHESFMKFCKENDLVVREQVQQSFILTCLRCKESMTDHLKNPIFSGNTTSAHDSAGHEISATRTQDFSGPRYTHKCGDDESGDWYLVEKKYIKDTPYRKTGSLLVFSRINPAKYKSECKIGLSYAKRNMHKSHKE